MIPLFPLPERLPAARLARLPRYAREQINGLRAAYVQADDTLREMYRRRDVVLELHSGEGYDDDPWCGVCANEDGALDWPCPTASALAGDARPGPKETP